MRYIQIKPFGRYLILRKKNISKENFFEAIKCKKTDGESLQNCLCELFCASGIDVDMLFRSFKEDYPSYSMSLNEFVSFHFGIDKKIAEDFLGLREKNECCYYVNNALINGYMENDLLTKQDVDELKIFQDLFKEAIKNL